MLEGFTENEARDLVRFPKNGEDALNEETQNIALEWGGNHPYLLQLAGLYLWDAKQSNKDIAWARQRFDRQAKVVPVNMGRKCLLWLKLIFWDLPVKLGGMGRFVGANLGDINDGIVGWVVILIFILAICGILNWQSVIDAIKVYQSITKFYRFL